MKLLPPPNKPWNYRFFFLAFAAGIVAQLATLMACCREPVWPWVRLFASLDLLVLGRVAFAWRKRELGRGWLFYSILWVVLVPVLWVCRMVAVRLGLL